MIAWLRRALGNRRQARQRAGLDALKVRYHTFRILLANNERALDRLAEVEAALSSGAPTADLAGRVEELVAVTFEMVDGLGRLAAKGAGALYARQLALEEALRAALERVEASPRPPSCLPLAQARDVAEAGGKAAGLAVLLQNGFPVPPGFVVTARACREFWREAGLEARLDQRLGELGGADDRRGAACAALRREILAAALPDWLRRDLDAAARDLGRTAGHGSPLALAVRSSAVTEDGPQHSFAGQLATVLNLSPETLERGILEVLAGAVSEQAVLYRRQAGLPEAGLDMAVLVQVMVPATAAGVVFSLDPVRPDTGRMLVSAVPGLGVLAVNGAAPVDIYRVSRDDPADAIAHVARKTRKAVAVAGGGVRREPVPDEARNAPVLSEATLSRLVRLSLAAEALAGSWRDLEYAVDAQGGLWLLQSRPARIVWGARRPPAPAGPLFAGGMTASPGRCLGRARHVADAAGLDAPESGPVVALLPFAAPEAARGLPRWQGLASCGGNPVDHLSTLAREAGRPMLTRAQGVMEAVPEGALVVLDADAGRIVPAPPAIGDIEGLLRPPQPGRGLRPAAPLPPGRALVHELVVPLGLTDAYGPTFSVLECRTLHDIVRFAHEAAVLALFEAGDALLAEAAPAVRVLRGDGPFECMVIDLGGGLRENAGGPRIGPEAIASIPLAALWRGLSGPVAAFAAPPSAVGVGAILARGLTDGRGRRPVGQPNYALATRDYVNVNARVEFHFAMIDAVCGPRARGNYVRLRFKGGGAASPLRERRAVCLETILRASGFFTNRQGDLLSANCTDAGQEATGEALALVGRLVLFSRLLDAAMTDDDAPHRAAQAFLAAPAPLARDSAAEQTKR
ncbi:MAG: PEP/pyruvate-binding domain-containing protein [Solidesulfovibrio sp.]|uniref:PEP/pyruvate-binding domain-containing protein n=1 Tax=Solidesulfovibrio sp. TaxID=2910990 RepID=UPI002B1F8FCE|nr:PEP/pyruvate-binding domain-containing protein [Solidesulfovibrio sp.]MEA4857607.1 PEP/pyruvate-binding domain-containing protein [Solidesulfovibrio sp.]